MTKLRLVTVMLYFFISLGNVYAKGGKGGGPKYSGDKHTSSHGGR